MESITITRKDLEEALAEVGDKVAEKAGKGDLFFKLTLQTLFLSFSRDVLIKLFGENE